MPRSPTSSTRTRELLSLSALLLLWSACGGGGGGSSGTGNSLVAQEDETPPNETPATSNSLRLGTPLRGDLTTAGDVDCFALQLSAGAVVQFELFGTRTDQAAWGATTNVPRLTILDRTANLNAKLLEQDYSGRFSVGWGWGTHDLDIPMFLVPAAGTYFVAVTQDDQTASGGEYILRASAVPISVTQHELEAPGVSLLNDTFGSAEEITPGVLYGFHVTGELDYYKFTLASPAVVRFEVSAYRNGVPDDTGFYFDTYVRLYGANGTTLLTANDDAWFYDSAIQYEFTTPGTYYFALGEFDPADSPYFLSFATSSAAATVESEPNDAAATANAIVYGERGSGSIALGETDFFSFAGTAGDMLRLQAFDNRNSQAGTAQVDCTLVGTDGTTALVTGGNLSLRTRTTILQETGTFYVKVEGLGASTPYAIGLTRFASSAYETEPNDTPATANALTQRVSGVIDALAPAQDVDLYQVSLTKDQLARFVCYASSSPTSSDGLGDYSGHGSNLAPLLELLDDQGLVVGSSTSVPAHGTFTESVTQPLPTCALVTAVGASGTYFVRISDANAASGASYTYVLEYEEP